MSGGGEIEEESGGGGNVFGEAPSAPVTLNLTALMDILSNLLFFLLASFGATVVMSVNASVPVQSADKSDIADKAQAVTVNVALAKSGFDLTAVGAGHTPEELDRLRKKIPSLPDGYDYASLVTSLTAIKEKYPKSDTVILTADQGIPYAEMIKTMDTARETEVKVAGMMRTLALFPTVVVSTVVK